MKQYLVDVPVMLNVWTRTDIQRKTFSVIKEARPSILFLISDGPRNAQERKMIEASRAVVEDIDWDCTVHKLYYEENQGMYATIKKELEFVFSHVDRCIFLEDDVLPSVSFFRFCAEMLEKYKDDLRITAINGTNYRGKYREGESDYFFTLANGIIGQAFWKRTYELFNDKVFQNQDLLRELGNYARRNPRDFIAGGVLKSTRDYMNDPLSYGHPAAIEFYRSFINITQSQLDIVPSVNMVTNLGAGDGAAHVSNYKLMPKRCQKLFYQERFEVAFPLRHPQYLIRDMEYEECLRLNRFDKLMERIEILAKNLIYLSPRELLSKAKRKISNKNKVET